MSHEHLIAGTMGGLTSTLVLHPLHLLKIRFAVSDGRSQVKRNYKSIPDALKTIVREEGFRGLYKGVVPNCIGAGSSWGLYFLLYNTIKKKMLDSNQQNHLGPLKHMAAGAGAGACTTALTNPIWVIKTRLCLQYDPIPVNAATSSNISNISSGLMEKKKQYSGTWDALKKVYRYEGFAGLYKGFIPGLMGVSHGAIQLAAYEELKKTYMTKYNLPDDHSFGSVEYLTCAAISKLLAASITYPFQVVRARLQDQHVEYKGVLDVVKRTWRHESYRGFYKGISAYLLHVTPNVCIVFFVYERVSKAFK